MYEEGNKNLSFNWSSLIIKLVILAAIVFLAGWIFVRVTNNSGSSTSSNSLAMDNNEYITDITAMKSAAFEYYTSSKLPEKVGGTDRLTLTQMINQKLLIDFTDDGKTCDTDSSYIQTTKTADGNYALKVSLTCGEKSDFIITTIESNEYNNATNTDVVVDDNNTTTTTDSSSNNSSSSNTSSNSSSNSSTSSSSSSSSSNSSSTYTKPSTTTQTVTTVVQTTVNIKFTCGSTNVCCNSCNTNNNNNSTNNSTEEQTYTLTIKYLYSDGTKAKDPYTGSYKKGDSYSITSPTISGYEADYSVVSGTMSGSDKTITVTYTKIAASTTRYYKLVKYSDWTEGYSSSSNAENKKVKETMYTYCKNEEKTYYTTGYVSDSTTLNYTYSYELQFLDLDPDEVSNVAVVNSSKSYFSSSLTDYKAYMNARGTLYMTGNTGKYDVSISNATSFRTSSLKSSNFTFGVSGVYYSGGVYRAKVTINYKNHSGVTGYYASNLGYNVYFVPLKFDVSYTDLDNCVKDTKDNQSNYSDYDVTNQTTEYVWYHRIVTYKWSTQKNLSGYEYTGEYEDR